MRQDITYIVEHLRERDIEEMAEYGLGAEDAVVHFGSCSAVASRIFFAVEPAAIVAFRHQTPSCLAVEMIATDRWPFVLRDVLKWAKEVRPQLLAHGYKRAECRTMDGHQDAIRFLERLGFELECRVPEYGASGKTFLQYAWRSRDHVFRAEDSSAA